MEEEEIMEVLVKTMQTLSQKIDEIESRTSYLVATCDVCGIQGHTQNNCQYNTPYYPIQAQYWDGNFHYNAHYHPDQRSQDYPYSDTYNSCWENYPDVSYQNNPPQPEKSSLETAMEAYLSSCAKANDSLTTNMSQSDAQYQQFKAQFEEIQVSPCQAQPPQFKFSQPPQKSNLENILEEFISTQGKKKEDFQTSQKKEDFETIFQEMKAHNKLMENSLAQLAQQVTQFVEMRTQTEIVPMSQIDDATLWSGKKFEESQNKVSNGKIFFDDDDDDFEDLTLIDPYASQEINSIENSFDNNDVDFLDDSFCMLFDEGDNMVLVDVDTDKDIVNPIVVDEIESNLDEIDMNVVKIENVYVSFVDPIWEECVKSNYRHIGDDFSKYFHIPEFLEHHISLTGQFIYLLGYLIGAHIIRLIQIRRYVHLYAFSPH